MIKMRTHRIRKTDMSYFKKFVLMYLFHNKDRV